MRNVRMDGHPTEAGAAIRADSPAPAYDALPSGAALRVHYLSKAFRPHFTPAARRARQARRSLTRSSTVAQALLCWPRPRRIVRAENNAGHLIDNVGPGTAPRRDLIRKHGLRSYAVERNALKARVDHLVQESAVFG